MMRALLLLAALAAPADATEAGLDVGHVVDGAIVHDDRVDDVDSTGVAWVRINLRLDDWSSPDDSTRRGPDQLTWFEAYDRIVDAFLARGIAVYGLINDEALSSRQPHGSDPWIADFAANAVKIVDHFKNRIRVYEIVNEPNDYAGGASARFTPRQFAKILQDTYLAVKHDAGHASDRCWQVDLVSGPLFSFDGAPSSAYLAQTYAAGRNELAWDYTHAATGSYPLDGIGYHIYVAQGSDSSTADAAQGTSQNLAALWSVIATNEGAATPKQIWISEFGFRADWVGEAEQAARMQASFGAFSASQHVALAHYFVLQDFPDGIYGVFDDQGHRRPSADMLKSLANGNRAPGNARIERIVMPQLAPGELGDAIVTLENRGSETWTSDVRLGAASGCPDASHANAVAWEPGDNGYATNLLDARVFLAAAVAPGESVEIRVPVRAPAQEGEYLFAARMVREGVAWFGPTVTGTLTVSARPAGSGSDEMRADGEGCSTTSGADPALMIALLFVRRRRRIR